MANQPNALHNPYHVTPRKPLTPKQKLKMFIEHGGMCCICGCKINGVHEAWDEHVDPLWRGGTNDADNRRPAHEKCARVKTSKEAGEKAKGERIAEKHYGAKRASSFRKPPGKFNWKSGRYERRSDDE